MKDLFEQIRPDKDFNLETLTYQEIFDGIKYDIAMAISRVSKNETNKQDLKLNIQRCRTKFAYAEDMNLYPKIYLDFVGGYSVILTPFNIQLMEVKQAVKMYECQELSQGFYNFMCEKFPNCDYEKIYEKYLIRVEKLKKQHGKNLFL